MFRDLNPYIGHHNAHADRVHNWKALVKRFTTFGKLLDPRVLGCSRELCDDFSEWFISHSHTIVRSMPIDAVLDFIRVFERTRQPFTDALASMINSLNSRGEDELLCLEGQPTYLGRFISSRTRDKIRKLILRNMEGLRTTERRRLPGARGWSPDILVRSGLIHPRYPSGSARDLIPRVHGSELVSGDEFSPEILHDIVDFEPERILVQEPHIRPHLRSGRSQIKHRMAHAIGKGGFESFDDEDIPYTDSEFDDDDDYLPSPYGYDDPGIGGQAVPPCLTPSYPKLDMFRDGFFDTYDDLGHVPRPVPVLI